MTANREQGEIDLTIGGHTYTLRLGIQAVCQMETASGRALGEVIVGVQVGRLTDILLLMWAGLQTYHAAQFKTPNAVAEAYGDTFDATVPLIDDVKRLIGLNTARAEGGEGAAATGENPRRARAGTGANSTSMRAASA